MVVTVAKPKVFKMCGTWVWRCDHPSGRPGDEFSEDSWRDPWTACLSAATRHASLFHGKTEAVEVHSFAHDDE